MSTSTDAILFYGFPIDEDAVDLRALEIDGETDDWYVANSNWEELKGPPQPNNNIDYKGAEWEAWRELKHEWEASPQNVGIDTHCSDSYPMYYVHGRQYRAYRGDLEEINPAALIPAPEDDANIKAFCERYGIPYSQPK